MISKSLIFLSFRAFTRNGHKRGPHNSTSDGNGREIHFSSVKPAFVPGEECSRFASSGRNFFKFLFAIPIRCANFCVALYADRPILGIRVGPFLGIFPGRSFRILGLRIPRVPTFATPRWTPFSICTHVEPKAGAEFCVDVSWLREVFNVELFSRSRIMASEWHPPSLRSFAKHRAFPVNGRRFYFFIYGPCDKP